MADAAAKSSFPFLRLPLELREAIYSLYFKPADRLIQTRELGEEGYHGGIYNFELSLMRVNRQIYEETKQVWKRENTFVMLAMPWPGDGMYRVYLLGTDGYNDDEGYSDMKDNEMSYKDLVPIVRTKIGTEFNDHQAIVRITAPFHQAVPEYKIILLAEDVHLFTRTWFYSALSYPSLNDRLSVTFTLRDHTRHTNLKTPTIALQERILLPFEHVKGLYHMTVNNYADEVEKELKRRMELPVPSLASCCERATLNMGKGDALILAGKPHEALNTYIEAFHAIHILIHGRTRRVLADVFFDEGIESGAFAGQVGMTVRITLRLRLVCRMIGAYLQLNQWNEAAFWGMRSIRIMRQTMNTEFEDFFTRIVGGNDVGFIYARTAVAFEKMETNSDKWARELKQYQHETWATSARLFESAGNFLAKSTSKAGLRKELEFFGVRPAIMRSYFSDVSEQTEDASSTMGQSGSGPE